MQRPGHVDLQRRFEGSEGRAVQLRAPDAKLPPVALGIGKGRIAGRRTAERQQETISGNQVPCPGIGNQRRVLADRMRDQAGIIGHDPPVPARRRVPPVAGERHGIGGQRRKVIARVETAPRCDPQQLAEPPRKGPRPHRFALDDAGIAIGRLATRRMPVDQQHLAATPLQVKGNTDADHAGAEDDDLAHVSTHRRQAGRKGHLQLVGGPIRCATDRMPPSGLSMPFDPSLREADHQHVARRHADRGAAGRAPVGLAQRHRRPVDLDHRRL